MEKFVRPVIEKKNKITLNRLNHLEEVRNRRTISHSRRISKGGFYSFSNPSLFSSTTKIQLMNVSKYYVNNFTPVNAVHDINLKIDSGDFAFIRGTSGSGKTTLMNMICGLLKPTEGDIFVNNYNIAYCKDSVSSALRSAFFGFVFQEHNLIHMLTLRENILVSSALNNKKREKIVSRTKLDLEGLCKTVNLDPSVLDNYPYEVSGGQQQRASFVRAMINNPEILLCDEATSSLDKDMTIQFLKFLQDMNKTQLTTIIFISHDDFICKAGNKTISMEEGIVKSIEYNDNPRLPTPEDWM